MISEILAPGVVSFETRVDPPGVVLFESEEATLARASDKRRRDFTTGRHCAHRALSLLGAPDGAVGSGPRGDPRWPAGVVGSITHCAGYRAAAVAWSAQVSVVGIDAEPNEPLPDGVLEAVSLPDERSQIHAHRRTGPGICWDRVLFSTKESVYKAWYPRAQRMLGFEEAAVTIHTGGALDARLLVPGPHLDGREITGFSGRWTVAGGFVLTAITAITATRTARAGTP